MGGIEAQSGFYYQNVLGTLRALDLIELGNPLFSVSFDNPAKAQYIDDIVAEGTRFATRAFVCMLKGRPQPISRGSTKLCTGGTPTILKQMKLGGTGFVTSTNSGFIENCLRRVMTNGCERVGPSTAHSLRLTTTST
jgi:hypothetical protein